MALSDQAKQNNATYWNTLTPSQKDAQRASWAALGYSVCDATGVYECSGATTCTDYIAINKIEAIPTKEQTLQAIADYENGLIDKTCLLAIEDAYFASGDNLVPCSDYKTMRGIGQSITTTQLQQAQSDHAAGIIDDLCLNEIERLPVSIQDQNNSGVLIGIGAAIAALGVGYYITSKKRE